MEFTVKVENRLTALMIKVSISMTEKAHAHFTPHRSMEIYNVNNNYPSVNFRTHLRLRFPPLSAYQSRYNQFLPILQIYEPNICE